MSLHLLHNMWALFSRLILDLFIRKVFNSSILLEEYSDLDAYLTLRHGVWNLSVTVYSSFRYLVDILFSSFVFVDFFLCFLLRFLFAVFFLFSLFPFFLFFSFLCSILSILCYYCFALSHLLSLLFYFRRFCRLCCLNVNINNEFLKF